VNGGFNDGTTRRKTLELFMIWESHFWKEDLLKKAAKLRVRKLQRRWPEASLAKLEQELMLGFYSIRKLHEADKLSTRTSQHLIKMIAYPWARKNVTKLNWHHVDRLYLFDKFTAEEHDLLFLCHQFVHSYVFIATFDDSANLEGILLASDRQRHKALLKITVDQIAVLFEKVGNDYPGSGTRTLNPKTGDYDVSSE